MTEELEAPGEAGREHFYAFMRHWLAARLLSERPDLHALLPKEYALGHALPTGRPMRQKAVALTKVRDDSPWLSPDARLLLAI